VEEPGNETAVPRETTYGADLEQVRSVAETVFGERLPLAVRFVEHLSTTGVERGIVGPREVPRMWTRHVLNCAVVAELLPVGVSVVDLGSGAGLPGVALALARPDLSVVLVEPLERRARWLRDLTADLGVPIEVRRARAEDLVGVVRAQVVTARAVAPLPRLLTWAVPLVEPGGAVLAIKGRAASVELEDAGPALRAQGLAGATVLSCGQGLLTEPTTVVRVPIPVGAHRPGPSRGRRTAGRPRREG